MFLLGLLGGSQSNTNEMAQKSVTKVVNAVINDISNTSSSESSQTVKTKQQITLVVKGLTIGSSFKLSNEAKSKIKSTLSVFSKGDFELQNDNKTQLTEVLAAASEQANSSAGGGGDQTNNSSIDQESITDIENIFKTSIENVVKTNTETLVDGTQLVTIIMYGPVLFSNIIVTQEQSMELLSAQISENFLKEFAKVSNDTELTKSLDSKSSQSNVSTGIAAGSSISIICCIIVIICIMTMM